MANTPHGSWLASPLGLGLAPPSGLCGRRCRGLNDRARFEISRPDKGGTDAVLRVQSTRYGAPEARRHRCRRGHPRRRSGEPSPPRRWRRFLSHFDPSLAVSESRSACLASSSRLHATGPTETPPRRGGAVCTSPATAGTRRATRPVAWNGETKPASNSLARYACPGASVALRRRSRPFCPCPQGAPGSSGAARRPTLLRWMSVTRGPSTDSTMPTCVKRLRPRPGGSRLYVS